MIRSTEPPYLQYLFRKAREANRPLSATFELTARCNFNCKMCYIHSADARQLKSRELTTGLWLGIADECKKAGIFTLLITGGEPLLRSDFEEIYVYCKKLGFELSVNTNASLITDAHIELFKKHNPVRLNVSLYGTGEDTYECVTCTRSYRKTYDNLLKLRDAGLNLRINSTVTQANACDIENINRVAKELGIPIETSCYVFPPSRLGKESFRPSPEQAARNMLINRKALLGDEFHKALQTLKDFRHEPVSAGGKQPLNMRCRAGLAAFWITYDGKMLPCGMLPEPSSSVIENGIEGAWSEINSKCREIVLPPECTDCAYDSVCDCCAASCYAETGSCDKLPDYPCKKAREYMKLLTEELENEV